MKFETPKINISMFEAENVVTKASDFIEGQNAVEARTALTTGVNAIEANRIFEFNY